MATKKPTPAKPKATKKPTPAKPKATAAQATAAQATAARDKQAAAMLKKLLSKMDSGLFDELCEEGKALVIEAAQLAGVDPKVFADEKEVRIDPDYAHMKLPIGYTGEAQRCSDYKIEATITHIPTGTVSEQFLDVYNVESYGL